MSAFDTNIMWLIQPAARSPAGHAGNQAGAREGGQCLAAPDSARDADFTVRVPERR